MTTWELASKRMLRELDEKLAQHAVDRKAGISDAASMEEALEREAVRLNAEVAQYEVEQRPALQC